MKGLQNQYVVVDMYLKKGMWKIVTPKEENKDESILYRCQNQSNNRPEIQNRKKKKKKKKRNYTNSSVAIALA